MKKTLFLSALLCMAAMSAFATNPDRTVHVATTAGDGVVLGTAESPYQLGFVNNNGTSYALILDNNTFISDSEGYAYVDPTSWKQIDSIALQGENSSATMTVANRNYGFLGGNHTETTLTLNGGTLVKKGSGEFTFVNTVQTADDTGVLDVQEGSLKIYAKKTVGLNAAGLTVKLANGTTMTVEQDSSLAALETAGTLSVSNGKVLTLGSLTLTGGTMTLDSKVNVTGGTTVNRDAVLQMNDNYAKALTLAGGTLKVTATDNFNKQHLTNLSLTADSVIDITSNNSGLIKGTSDTGFGTAELNMGDGNKLTLSGGSRFCLMDVETTGHGTLAVDRNGSYVQIAHGGVTGHTADLSTVVMELSGTHLVLSSENTLKVAGLANKDGNTAGTALEMDGGGDSGTRNLVIAGDGHEHTYLGGFADNTRVNLSMTGAGTQNFSLTGSVNMALESLTAEGGTMNFFLNHDTNSNRRLTTGSLTLSGGVVNVYDKNATEGTAGLITTTNGLTVTQDTTMEANLVVSGGTITFADNATLTMGCSVSIGETGTVTVVLTQDMVDAVAATGRYDLFHSVESATLGNIVFVAADGVTLNDGTAYSLQWDGASIYVAPEPATATLSLLALAGLCARRRRH